ncbi:MAG TPA: hypothetical protein DCF63_11520 [Planctomycetaceae bacterium]|nr:hypothetical protein [Planctomycetaceae bacterium]
MSGPMNIEQRVTISLALQRYLNAVDRFETASNEFNAACLAMRNTLPQCCRFIANSSLSHYLVNSDHEGNFEVEQVETI